MAPGISGFDEYTRPLTAKGFRDAMNLCETLSSTRIDAAYSSPYLLARQTIEPITQARGLTIETVDDLRERLLSPSDLPEWRSHLKRSWNDFDYAPPGGETSRDAQARIVRVLDMIASRQQAGTVILASHGNLIALALNAFMPNVDYEFWESMPMPAVFTLMRDGGSWRLR
jgi:2,3-bisphosphoglycerate-dependent phosphoglycerate mutase